MRSHWTISANGCRMSSNLVGATGLHTPSKTAVQGTHAAPYSDFRLDSKARDEIIHKRHAAGEGVADLAREFGISPQRVYQIVNFNSK
jgi:helix-turn-helix resolvase-like protein